MPIAGLHGAGLNGLRLDSDGFYVTKLCGARLYGAVLYGDGFN